MLEEAKNENSQKELDDVLQENIKQVKNRERRWHFTTWREAILSFCNEYQIVKEDEDQVLEEPCSEIDEPGVITEELAKDEDQIIKEACSKDIQATVTKCSKCNVPGYISKDLSNEIRTLLFKNAKGKFSTSWEGQDLESNEKYVYGIIQKAAGTCSILAVIQAYILNNLLFDTENGANSNNVDATTECLRVDKKSFMVARQHALASILWKIGERKHVIIADQPENEDNYLKDWTLLHFDNYQDVVKYYEKKFEQLGGYKNPCISLLYSALLTRGLDNFETDRDEALRLIYDRTVTQEIVNLLLFGKGIANVFDEGYHDFVGFRGIPAQSEIGFLSSQVTVGNNFMKPTNPIWVAHTDHHYSVIFSTKKLEGDDDPEKFKIFGYDQMSKNETQYVLTRNDARNDANKSLKRIHVCIQSRWSNYKIEEIELN